MVNLANYYEGENRPAFLHVLSVFGYRAWDCCLFYSVPDRPEGPTAGTESARELCVLIVSSVCGLLFETDRPEFFVQPGYFGLGVGGEGQTAVAAVDADEFHAGFAAADAAAVVDDHVHDVHRLLLRRAGLFEVAGHEGVVDVLVGAERVVVGAAHAAARADGHAAEQHFVEPVEDVEAAAVETDAFDHLHEVVRRELDAVQVGNLFRAILQEVDHRQVDARHRGNVVGVEGQRCACSGDGFVEGHQFFDRAGWLTLFFGGANPPDERKEGVANVCYIL